LNTQAGNRKNDPGSFSYVLNDFLELRAGADPKKARSLKTYLLSLGEEDLTLSPVEGFRLNGHLVLIEKEKIHTPHHLVFFNPDKGSFRIKEIPS
jgi:hypothetical protein